MAAVKASLRRMSGVLSALTSVWSTPPPRASALGRGAGAARGLDLRARGAREAVGAHGQALRHLAAGEHLDRHALARGEAGGGQALRRNLGAVVEASVEVADVDGLRLRPEGLERHRLLHVRTAQLSEAHVEGHLAALEAVADLRGRASAARRAASGRRRWRSGPG